MKPSVKATVRPLHSSSRPEILVAVNKRRRRPFRELLRDTRGRAPAEPAIMLPFFIIVWGCIIFVVRRYDQSIEMSQQARHCAWTHVMSACETDTPCGISDGANLADSEFPGGAGGFLEDLSGDIPFVDWMFEGLFGSDITASTDTTVDAPEAVGGGSRRVAGAMALTCNEKPRGDLGDILHDAFCTLSPWCP